ncbi:MAG: hypothetical protein V1750_04565 [Acidobacteriota bacterium]
MPSSPTTRLAVALYVLVIPALADCGRPRPAGDSQHELAAGPPGSEAQPPVGRKERHEGHMIRLKPYSCVDQQGIGGEAFSLLMPADWQFEGGIYWRLDNPGFPAYSACRVSNPRGAEEFEVFPNLPYFWTNNPMVSNMFPVGAKYFGNTVHPPLGATQALRQLVLPAYRGNAVALSVTGEQPVPELARLVQEMQARMQPQAGIQVDAAKIRFTYTAGGQPIEEELYGVVQMFSFPLQTMYGTVTNQTWWVDYLFSFKAARGRLDAASKLLQTIAFSFKVNPQWFARYSALIETLIRQQIQHIRHVGEIGRMVAETGREIREDQMRSWEANQAVYDRLATDWSQHIRGVDEYYNPFEERAVELPSGYDNAWVNNLGEYIVSESPSYDPNLGSNLSWQQMQRRR